MRQDTFSLNPVAKLSERTFTTAIMAEKRQELVVTQVC